MENNRAGGYTHLRQLTQEEKELFKEVIDQILSVKYVPLGVATQVVAGTNYAFLCETKVLIPDSNSYNTLVIIHKPLPGANEPSRIMEIKTVNVIDALL